MAPQILLLFSAFLHAAWNSLTKTSKEKDLFVFLTISLSCFLVVTPFLLPDTKFFLGGKQGFIYAILAGVFESGYLIAMAKGFARASLAKAYSVMRGGAMVLVWAISLLLGTESVSIVGAVGTLLVLIGIGINGLVKKPGESLTENTLKWPLIGAFFIAGQHIFYGQSLHQGAEPKSLFFTSLLISLPILFFFLRKDFVIRTKSLFGREWKSLVGSSLAATIGFVVFLYGLKNSGPGYAITLRNTSIFFSIGFSFWIKDQITKMQIVGALVTGFGAMVLSFG